MEKQKLNITLEVLNEVSINFPETKQFIQEHLKQKCLKEKHISRRDNLLFFANLEAKS